MLTESELNLKKIYPTLKLVWMTLHQITKVDFANLNWTIVQLSQLCSTFAYMSNFGSNYSAVLYSIFFK